MNNVTVTVGQNAELKCEVENLNNYKVSENRFEQKLEGERYLVNCGNKKCEVVGISHKIFRPHCGNKVRT